MYDPSEIAELARAGQVQDLLARALQPGMPEGWFTTVASVIAGDPERTPAERAAARRALRSQTRQQEFERAAAERERQRSEFARLPAASSAVADEGPRDNPFEDELAA